MKGMGAFSFADVVLRNSVLGTFRFYDEDERDRVLDFLLGQH